MGAFWAGERFADTGIAQGGEARGAGGPRHGGAKLGTMPKTVLPDARVSPRFAGICTFCRYPRLEDVLPENRPVDGDEVADALARIEIGEEGDEAPPSGKVGALTARELRVVCAVVVKLGDAAAVLEVGSGTQVGLGPETAPILCRVFAELVKSAK